jgi:hypothetical protein
MFFSVPMKWQYPNQRLMYICLHAKETQLMKTDVAFNIDSFLGFF